MARILTTLINGQERATIPVLDRGLQFGDGLFTTLAVHDGVALCLEAHLLRLEQGALVLGIPMSRPRLAAEVRSIVTGCQRAVLKIIISRGVSGRGYACPVACRPTRILSLLSWPKWQGRPSQEGVVVRFCDHRLSEHPVLAGIKHLNRLDQVLARREWSTKEVAEGLMLDQSGRIVEGTMSNVFLRHGRVWRTPALRHCGVAGIIRTAILQHLQDLRWPLEVGDVLPGEIAAADELFLCNSLIGIWPVRRLGTLQFQDFSAARILTTALMKKGMIAPC